MLVMVRSWAGEPRPFTVDIVDPSAGTIVDSIELDASSDGISRWVDLDASGRYLLFTTGDGTLRWSDFQVTGSFGGQWGDAGW